MSSFPPEVLAHALHEFDAKHSLPTTTAHSGPKKALPFGQTIAIFHPDTKKFMGYGEYGGQETMSHKQADWLEGIRLHLVKYVSEHPDSPLTPEDLELSSGSLTSEKIHFEGQKVDGSNFYFVQVPHSTKN